MESILVSAAVAGVVNKITDVTGNLIVGEIAGQCRWKEDLRWLEREMRRLETYLSDLDARVSWQGESKRFLNFIKDISELADYVGKTIEGYDNFFGKKRCCGYFRWRRLCLMMKIKKIKRRVNEINDAKSLYGIPDLVDRRTFNFRFDKSNVVGMEEHVNTMISRLLISGARGCIISIVGMPGVGKTTLAQQVYNLAWNHFRCLAWVHVSRNRSVEELMEDIAKQVGLGKEKREENLVQNLYTFFERERYVIFLDDIWCTKTWDKLKVCIPESSSRSIVVTSRNTSVGRGIGGERSLYELKPLDQKDSWELLSKLIMAHEENDSMHIPSELEDIGRQIVDECGGVPLAIVATAHNLRRRERRRDLWSKVLKNVHRDEEISNSLNLSYKDLRSPLKLCFLDFGISSKCREIPAGHIIRQWVAKGFIHSNSNSTRTVEDTAEDYLEELIERNLIIVAQREVDGRVKSCHVNVLLCNFCIYEARENNIFEMDYSSSNSVTEGLTCVNPAIEGHTATEGSIFFQGDRRQQQRIFKITFPNLRFLEVQHVHKTDWPFVHLDELSNLVHLTFLVDGHLDVPAIIINSKNLETLDAKACKSVTLPTVIWKMPRLRKLCLPRFTKFRHMTGSSNPESEEVNHPNLEHLFSDMEKIGLLARSMPIWNKKGTLNLQIMEDNENVASPEVQLSGGQNLDSDFRRLNISVYGNLMELNVNCSIGMLPALPITVRKITLVVHRSEQDCVEFGEQIKSHVKKLIKTMGLLPEDDLEKLVELLTAYLRTAQCSFHVKEPCNTKKHEPEEQRMHFPVVQPWQKSHIKELEKLYLIRNTPTHQRANYAMCSDVVELQTFGFETEDVALEDQDESPTMGQTLGSEEARPGRSLIAPSKKEIVKANDEISEDTVFLGGIPPVMAFYNEVTSTLLTPDAVHNIVLNPDIYGREMKLFFEREDFSFCLMEEISSNCIVLYQTYLFQKLKELSLNNKYSFIVPTFASVGPGTREIRAGDLYSELVVVPGQLALTPFNVGNHWLLLVIDPYANIVYILNSLNTGVYQEIKDVLDPAFEFFNSSKQLTLCNSVSYDVVQCPLQAGNTECGYFVLRFMRDIIFNHGTPIKSLYKNKRPFSQDLLDEVRNEWIEFYNQVK